MNELVRLHKIFCLSQHPLWIQVCNRYWKEIERYWTSERQVAAWQNCEKVVKRVEDCLKVAGILQAPLSVVDEMYLIELMEYYQIDYYSDQGLVDRTSFSGILAFIFLRFLPAINICTLCILAVACLSLDPAEIPKGLLTLTPVYKEEGDFLLWLNKNFTKIQNIQESIITTTKTFNSVFVFSERTAENKKLIPKCRDTFNSLVKLKNSEYRTKKVLPAVKTPEKRISDKAFKCIMPIEGRSIKLQYQSDSKIQLVKSSLIKLEKKNIIHCKEYSSKFMETIVEQCNYSGCPSPDTLSPRIFKSIRINQTPVMNFRDFRNNTPYTKDKRIKAKVDSKSASTNSIRRVGRVRFRN